MSLKHATEFEDEANLEEDYELGETLDPKTPMMG